MSLLLCHKMHACQQKHAHMHLGWLCKLRSLCVFPKGISVMPGAKLTNWQIGLSAHMCKQQQNEECLGSPAT
jgi:hypothetical protein